MSGAIIAPPTDGRDLLLPERLRRFDVPVIEIDGWRERGLPKLDPVGSLNHHTAGPAPKHGVAPSLGTCIKGRPDLAGPLCNVFVGRDLIARVVASGRANHGGAGSWGGASGNSRFYGTEVEHQGTKAEPVSAPLIETMARVQAALAAGQFGADMVAQHCEYATPRGRKPDFVCSVLDPDLFRLRVGVLIAAGGVPDLTPGHPGVVLGPPPPVRQTIAIGAANDPEVVRYIQRGLNAVLPMWGMGYDVAESGVFDLATRLGLRAFKRGANNKQWQSAPGHVVIDRLFADTEDDRAGRLTLAYLRFFAGLGS